jgi:hypothetical protein
MNHLIWDRRSDTSYESEVKLKQLNFKGFETVIDFAPI